MRTLLLTSLLSLTLMCLLPAQETIGTLQPAAGPGGASYLIEAEDILFLDYARKPDGYWLFEPGGPSRPDTAQVVVFLHGYGGYNPMVYGSWIKHLVRRGNIVIYPRYQRNLVLPRPPRFGKHVAQAIRDALAGLRSEGHIVPLTEPLIIIGHSYGGVIAADLGVHFEDYGIPQPKGLLLITPGTGPLKGGRLESYEDLPPEVKLLIVASDQDHVVGDEFARLVFETAIHTPQRNLIYQYADSLGTGAGHNQSYCVDPDFDTGVRNYTARKALRISTLDAVDYNGYWKLLDALIACTRDGVWCEYAFDNTPLQRSLGHWSDGRPVRPLRVFTPAEYHAGMSAQ